MFSTLYIISWGYHILSLFWYKISFPFPFISFHFLGPLPYHPFPANHSRPSLLVPFYSLIPQFLFFHFHPITHSDSFRLPFASVSLFPKFHSSLFATSFISYHCPTCDLRLVPYADLGCGPFLLSNQMNHPSHWSTDRSSDRSYNHLKDKILTSSFCLINQSRKCIGFLPLIKTKLRTNSV